MATFKLTTKYYIKIHDKNLPGDDGWKCDLEMNSARVDECLTKSDLSWIDKFITYEKILQEVFEDDGSYRSKYTEPICVKEFEIIDKEGRYMIKEKEDRCL